MYLRAKSLMKDHNKRVKVAKKGGIKPGATVLDR